MDQGHSASAVAQVWTALGGDPGLLSRLAWHEVPGVLPARLPVRDLARACVAACSLAAAEYAAEGGRVPQVRVDDGAVATAFTSERHLRIDGRAPTTFAPLSRFWRTADGWVRTHANYPHHKAALLAALDVPEERVGAELAGRSALEVEESVYAAGGLAVALRTRAEWAAHPQGAEVARHPLLTVEQLDEAAPVTAPTAPASARARGGAGGPGRPGGSGGTGGSGGLGGFGGPSGPGGRLRVLDLTRVISGPVATRTLALLGADVLRVDAPRHPELPDQHADTGFGKRSTLLDLARATDRRTFDGLLAEADVVVTGYRPGALDRFGLSPEALAARRPGLVVAGISAWGDYGPWAGRRGFDSLVQVASGIAAAESDEGVLTGGTTGTATPGALPAQALDHGTGYLLAAAVLRALTEQRTEGGTRYVRFALAQTAHWLQELGARGPGAGTGTAGQSQGQGQGQRQGADPGAGAGADPSAGAVPAYDPEEYLLETDSTLGHLRYARSPVGYDGGPTDWVRPPGHWGADRAEWP